MACDSLLLGPGPLSGPVSVPPSKSLLHRALICARLAGCPSAVKPPTRPSDDICATLRALDAIFAPIRKDGNPALVDCGESGTTLRLLVPVAAAFGRAAVFVGAGRLPRRPMAPYADALEDGGVKFEFPERPGEFLPLRVSGALRPGIYTLPGDVSSQFVSGLLLALPLVGGASEIRLASALQSRPYVEMTIAVMREFGVSVSETEHGFAVPGGARYAPPPGGAFQVEGDASQEAFWHLANHLGSNVSITSPASAELQGDAVFPSVLETIRAATPNSSPPEIDVSQIPDLVPAIAAAAAFSPRGVVVTHGERLRLKESDRIATSVALLRSFGARAEERPDGLAVFPIPTHAIGRDSKGDVSEPSVHADAAGDHRIAMAAAMLATRRHCELRGASSVAKSWPSFFDDYRRAGGRVEVLSQ